MKFGIVTFLGVVLLAALTEAIVGSPPHFGKREAVMVPNEAAIVKRNGPPYLDEDFGRGKREAVAKRAGPPYDFGMGKREAVVKRAGPPYGFGLGKRETVVERNGPTFKK
ncbi:uncharacterized protein LOC119765445 isoform X2 [Culex quinquefasciatus]|uniref:uncharacterized protein LOC119765445 isoform X2 n=1 Tax=Culex quinquefasciatus TaxID=7176 RepID=UPI0018E3E4A6|nr:uncharacterized protein LOC119765445 isoform X2 [Culex quinquefasciatus]